MTEIDEPDDEPEDEQTAEPEWSRPPAQLLAAFRAIESIEHIGVLLIDDGFDANSIRVLTAWEHTDHRWSAPSEPCPDDGMPTATAWKWLLSGWDVDIAAIAAGSGLSRDVVRERVAVLQHARLIYPDGGIAAAARKAVTATIRERLKRGVQKKGKDEKKDPSAN